MTAERRNDGTAGGSSAVSPSRRSAVPSSRRTPWTLLRDEAGRPGWENMALDHGLLDLAEREGRGFLRIYRWDPSCISFGRHEPALRRYDRERIESLGLATVRRPTGGRAVWHARELTYAAAAPAAWFGSLAECYHAIHATLAAALRRLGVAAALAPAPDRAPGPGEGPCFATAAGGEVLVEGRKVVGSAQLRVGDSFLQHGSLLLEDGQDVLATVSRGHAVSADIAPLSALLGRRVAFEEAQDAVLGAWEPRPAPVGAGEERVLAGLAGRHAARYRSARWIWEGRDP